MDNQSVDRAYRIGQTKPVYIYRVASIGTVEEKIMVRQLFKMGLANLTYSNQQQKRFFTSDDLGQGTLLQLCEEDLLTSRYAEQLASHADRAPPYPDAVRQHLDELQKMPCYHAVNDRSLLLPPSSAVPVVQGLDVVLPQQVRNLTRSMGGLTVGGAGATSAPEGASRAHRRSAALSGV